MMPRKMDWNSEADLGLIRDFMASKDGSEPINGLPVQVSMWQK